MTLPCLLTLQHDTTTCLFTLSFQSEYKINRNVKKEVNHVRIINEDRLASFRKELNFQPWDDMLNTNDVNHA